MRIVFMGTPEFALPSLRGLLDHPYEIAAVVTVPDKPRGRGQKVASSPVKEFAVERRLPVLQPESLKETGFVNALTTLKPDLIVVVAFRILPPSVFTIPALGSFNLHASLLPRYRGAAPINWAIIRGERETGVTTFFLKESVDTGGILLQERIPIGPDETAGELHDRLAALGGAVVVRTVQLIESGKTSAIAQDDRLATPAPKIFREHCAIPWERSARDVHNFIRGLSPHPCAWARHAGTTLRIYRSAVAGTEPRDTGSPPGAITRVEQDKVLVSTGQGEVALLELQQEGRRRMGIAEFLRGYPMRAGDTLAVPPVQP